MPESLLHRRTLLLSMLAFPLLAAEKSQLKAIRIPQNPLVRIQVPPSVGDNVNGPTVIRVPRWVKQPLGRYYMYFGHHKGLFLRLAYANSLRGPWKVYEPGVLRVEDTAFYRPQPDPQEPSQFLYTHVASPEILVDESRERILLWFHGYWTEGKRWPEKRDEAAKWMMQNGYSQFTQTAESIDGLHFETRPAITKTNYLRVFSYSGYYYAMARLGKLFRSKDPFGAFEPGPDPFRETAYADRVRHVTLLRQADVLHVFFSAIGDTPERILHTTIGLNGDWTGWKTSGIDEVLTPETSYECSNLPNIPSEEGEIDHPARQLRDPSVFHEDGKTFLFYTVCGEQGIAAAEITFDGAR